MHYSWFRRASKLFDSFRIQPVDRWTNTTPSKTATWQTRRLHPRVCIVVVVVPPIPPFTAILPSRCVSATRDETISDIFKFAKSMKLFFHRTCTERRYHHQPAKNFILTPFYWLLPFRRTSVEGKHLKQIAIFSTVIAGGFYSVKTSGWWVKFENKFPAFSRVGWTCRVKVAAEGGDDFIRDRPCLVPRSATHLHPSVPRAKARIYCLGEIEHAACTQTRIRTLF